MAAETAGTRDKSRRVKNHILDRYLKLADRVDQKGEGDLSENEDSRYWELTLNFAKNVLPRAQEVTGEDGKPIPITNLPYVPTNNSNIEDSEDVQKNPGDTGGDISKQDNIDSSSSDSPKSA